MDFCFYGLNYGFDVGEVVVVVGFKCEVVEYVYVDIVVKCLVMCYFYVGLLLVEKVEELNRLD